jgi:hypothetical protein
LHALGNTLCVVISISIYYNCNYYVLSFKLIYNSVYFLKFVVHKINSEMIKSEMVVLIGKENDDVINANMTVN